MDKHTKLSVNINKVALIRNSRGSNKPNLMQFAKDCEEFGAQGITVHPRPDERHITYADLEPLMKQNKSEFNIEGNPSPFFIDLVCKIKPHQVTLVPDSDQQLTSDHGWDTKSNLQFLKNTIKTFKDEGIRVSIFVDPEIETISYAKETGADRIELYTGPYAHDFESNPEKAIEPYIRAALHANQLGLGINAGHDLDLLNLNYFYKNIPNLLEVSIGHALISDALYFGIHNTIRMYLNRLHPDYAP
jgi:pyridoxine 5-phosphate synthase